MTLGVKEAKRVQKYYEPKKVQLLGGTLIKTGEKRPDSAKESNYVEIQRDLTTLGCKNRAEDVAEAAGILGKILGRTVEVKEPPNDNGAARKLTELQDSSSTVQQVIAGVDVRLDTFQLKHQHRRHPIGTRHKGGGNRFDDTCDIAWHRAVTLPYMAQWANNLGAMIEGEERYHGQAIPVNNVHYEAHCLFANGQKYVLFHCYPSNNSPLRGPNA
jgi:hypothetical protein